MTHVTAGRSVWHRLGLLSLIALHAACPVGAEAQDDRPRLMLNPGGPVGGVRSVTFSPDSSRLYAAGAGKVVNAWELQRGEAAIRAIPADPLRWEIARGLRGRIYTMDVAPTGTLAIGGFSAREATGDIALFDPSRQRLLAILPRHRPDVPEPGLQPGHLQTVVSVDFSPSGAQLVTLSIDGEVRLWPPQGVESRIVQPAGRVTDGRVQAAAFLDEQRIVFPQPDPRQPAAWRLAVADVNALARPARVLGQPVFWYGIAAMAVSPDGRMLAASDHLGEVTLLSDDGQLSTRPLNRPRPLQNGAPVRNVAALSFGRGGWLAVSTTADAQGTCWFELWDTATDPPRLLQEFAVGRGAVAFGTAFSPDGTLLAFTRADRPTVTVVPIGMNGPVALDVAQSIELGGRGRLPANVEFVGTEGYRIAIGSRTDSDRVMFDLAALRTVPAAAGPVPPAARPTAASGWQLKAAGVSSTGQQELSLVPPGRTTPRCAVLLDTAQQGDYLSHTWLTDAGGQAVGVAIATRRMDGIFLYDLPPSGRCRLLRYLRDHTDTINGLSVSHDGRYLVSSSEDQTVKVWSLAGLAGISDAGRNAADPGAAFPGASQWGATFAVLDGRLVVTSALGAGIAVHRDLQVGDVVTRVTFAGPTGVQSPNDPRGMLDVLATIPPWQTVRLSTQRNGQLREEDLLITPAWEPLATLFLDRTDEWALWTPQGVYDASVGGDELFGWQVNRGRTADPQYFRAEKFRRELERPDVMRQLLAAGSLRDAEAALNAAQARPIGDIAADIPRLRLIAPRMGEQIAAGQQVTVQAAVTYPQGTGPEDYRLRMFVNQIDGGQPAAQQVGNEFAYTWTVPPAGGPNRVLVRVEEVGGAANALFEDAVVQVSAEPRPGAMKMHVFALAAENYAGLLHQPFCNDDASGLAELLQSHTGKQYGIGEVRVLTDETVREAVTKASVTQQIVEFRARLQTVNPEDLLVVFIAGHGRAYGADYFFIPPDEALGTEPGEAIIRQVGIPWDEFRLLAEIPCRKVFLLDTCYSGNVAQAEKNSLRPLKTMQAMIFAATSENQEALGQHPDRQNGLFTGYLIDGCRGKADGVEAYDPVNPKFAANRDGQINLLEVVSYVSHNVRGFNRFQRPKYTPIELLNFVDLPLFTVPVE